MSSSASSSTTSSSSSSAAARPKEIEIMATILCENAKTNMMRPILEKTQVTSQLIEKTNVKVMVTCPRCEGAGFNKFYGPTKEDNLKDAGLFTSFESTNFYKNKIVTDATKCQKCAGHGLVRRQIGLSLNANEPEFDTSNLPFLQPNDE